MSYWRRTERFIKRRKVTVKEISYKCLQKAKTFFYVKNSANEKSVFVVTIVTNIPQSTQNIIYMRPKVKLVKGKK